jgi:tetratricopeptide (TPR) repeat protein
LGLLIIIGWGVKDFVVNRPRIRIAATVIAVIVLLSMLILTRIQVGHWQNTLTLFEYALNVTRNNYVAEDSYGCALLEKGLVNEAEKHLRNAVRITPLFVDARNDLALALSKQKKYDEALMCLKQALELEPNNSDIHNKIGMVLLTTGRSDEAIKYLNEGLKINKDQEAYANLGSAYIQTGKYDLAIVNLTKAIELKPDRIDVLNKLAWLSAAVDDASIHNAQKGIEFAQRGCELTGYKDPVLLDTLAVAYAAAGRFDEAKATAEKALRIAKEAGRENLAAEIQKRIKLYEADQPYREK